VVLVAALVYIVVRGKINFQYPRDPDDSKRLPPAMPSLPAPSPKPQLSDGK
jgi:hypothetical protein